jgi:very-short-patch-repair endonuclease
MWAIVRGRKLVGWKIRRQHRIGEFILDFYCAQAQLAIELDGASHFTDDGRKFDEMRTTALRRLGITVLRFENREVIANPGLTAACLLEALKNCPSPLTPLPE